MNRILHITPDFNYSCGRSKLVFLYLKYFGNNNNYETHFITNSGDSLDRLKEIPSLKYVIFDFSTGIKNIFYKRRFYKYLKNYVIINKIELIHTHHRFLEFVSVRIGKELNIKTVTSAHSFVTGFKRISFRSDKIISVSNSVSSYLIKYYNVKEENLVTLYNPVEQFPEIDFEEGKKLRIENEISPDQRVLLFMGRINRLKGYDILIQSFDAVREKIRDAVLLVCGSTEDKKLGLMIDNLQVPIKILKPRKDNQFLYSIADIVILPSRVDPFPFVMIESGTFKKPFIGGNTGGIAEFIEDGKNGLLIDPENPQQLAEKIIYLLNNPDVGKIFGANLNEKVNRLCNFSNYFFQVENIYNSLLNSK
jgi:glycosyltransferase involved in cell wall biosynthesis